VGSTKISRVNYDDPAHRRIDRDQFVFVDGSLRPEHFLVMGSGQANVIYDYLVYEHEPTIVEILQTIKSRIYIRLPDFAETMDYHKNNPQERQKAPVISFCGAIEDRLHAGRYFAYVGSSRRGLYMNWCERYRRWDQRCRFLVVSK
jgi:hypothetical protein